MPTEQRAKLETRDAVAKAICKSRTCEGFNCCQWPANTGRKQCPVKDGGYDDAADAAIEALAALGWVSPEFKQVTQEPDGWSDWQFPTEDYQMKCCDCGLVHDMDFRPFAEANRDAEGNFNAIDLPWPIRVMFRARRAGAVSGTHVAQDEREGAT